MCPEHVTGILKGFWSSMQRMQCQMKNGEDFEGCVDLLISCAILYNLLIRLGDQWLELYDYNDPPKLQVIPEIHENGAS